MLKEAGKTDRERDANHSGVVEHRIKAPRRDARRDILTMNYTEYHEYAMRMNTDGLEATGKQGVDEKNIVDAWREAS